MGTPELRRPINVGGYTAALWFQEEKGWGGGGNPGLSP